MTTKTLYTYYTPKLGKGGYSLEDTLEETPYDLRDILNGESAETSALLKNLNETIEAISKEYHIDCLGMYQKRKNKKNEEVLVKLAYIGAPSRAEYPLTEAFAKISNKSAVALSGKEKIIPRVGSDDGVHYEYDIKVKSAFCAPLFGKDGKVIGVINAESFSENFFQEEMVSVLRKFCDSISEKNLPSLFGKEKAYLEVSAQIRAILSDAPDDIVTMSTISCVLSQTFSSFFWTGFYRKVSDKDELIVGPYQGTLGCLRIPFEKGVCGKAAREEKTIIVSDVHAFPGHIACDSRSQSEIVVPVFNAQKNLIAVLDIDATEKNQFDEVDQKYLEEIVRIFSEKRNK